MEIQCKKLTKVYNDNVVLDALDFCKSITTLAIIGPSGGGKSTLLRILGGLEDISDGDVCINGESIKVKDKQLQQYRKDVGFVFQNGGLFHHISAFQNITLPLIQVHGYTKERAREVATKLLARFGLLAHKDKLPSMLSGGQVQRVAIARAIASKPKFILFDEPTSALDPEYTNEVLGIINELKEEGMKFIIVTHEMGFAKNACDQVMFLSDGKVVDCLSSKDMFENNNNDIINKFLSTHKTWEL